MNVSSFRYTKLYLLQNYGELKYIYHILSCIIYIQISFEKLIFLSKNYTPSAPSNSTGFKLDKTEGVYIYTYNNAY